MSTDGGDRITLTKTGDDSGDSITLTNTGNSSNSIAIADGAAPAGGRTVLNGHGTVPHVVHGVSLWGGATFCDPDSTKYQHTYVPRVHTFEGITCPACLREAVKILIGRLEEKRQLRDAP